MYFFFVLYWLPTFAIIAKKQIKGVNLIPKATFKRKTIYLKDYVRNLCANGEEVFSPLWRETLWL